MPTATNTTTNQPTQVSSRPGRTTRPASSSLPRMIALALLGLIVILGLAVFIAWLIVHPKHLKFTVEDASIKNFNVTNDHINANYDFLIRAHNPNKRISVYYDLIEVSVAYNSQTVAFNTLAPFHQRKHNVTDLDAKLESREIALSSSMSRDIKSEKAHAASLKLQVRLKAKTRYKVGGIKIRRHRMKIFCPDVTVHFSSSKSFDRVYCDVDY